VGSGFRVPCIIVSPWTVGGYACSDTFDHTSTLQLIEQVFLSGQPVNTNISAWRRETFGDLTTAFQSGPGASTPPSDPNFTYSSVSNELNVQTANTSGSTKLPAPAFPRASQTAPSQASGSRPQAG
jgi:phospholipase C